MTAQAAAPATTCDYSDEQLRAAWRRYKLRSWPATFEEAMADPVCSRLVRLHAAHIAHPSTTPGAIPGPTVAPGAAPTPRPRFAAPPPGWVDHKRAAAGDRDDD